MGINLRKVLLFLGLTFLFSWLLAFLFFAFVNRSNQLAATAMMSAYMLAPMISAIIVQKFIFHDSLQEPLGISFRLNRQSCMVL